MAFVRHEGHLLFQLTYATIVKDIDGVLKYKDDALVYKNLYCSCATSSYCKILKTWELRGLKIYRSSSLDCSPVPLEVAQNEKNHLVVQKHGQNHLFSVFCKFLSGSMEVIMK